MYYIDRIPGSQSALRLVSSYDQALESVAVSSVRPSGLILAHAPQGAGQGAVTVTGPYTGASDAELDIEITATAGSTAIVGDPVFQGVGNQVMSDVAVDTGLASQVITFELVKISPDPIYAQLTLDDGKTLLAATIGTAGNSVSATVLTEPAIGAAVGNLPERWSAGETGQTSATFNFGAVPLDSLGQIPTDAPYLRFGDRWTVHRHYWERDDTGQVTYRLWPAPPVDLPAGTPVYPVTGTWSVRITDGVTPTDYTGLLTRYDLYTALQNDGSALAQAPNIVVEDLAPGGMASSPLNLVTRAYVHSVDTQGSAALEDNPLQNLQVDTTLPTQIITLRCIQADRRNRETWDVYGPAYPRQSTVTQGKFSANGVSFVIPRVETPENLTTPRIYVSGHSIAAGGDKPELVRPAIGAAAKNATLNLRYEARPVDQPCTPVPVLGGPKIECLGKVVLTTLASGGPMDSALKTRLQAWLDDFQAYVAANYTNFEIVDSAVFSRYLNVPGYASNTAQWEAIYGKREVAVYRDILEQFVETAKKITDLDVTTQAAQRTAGLAELDLAYTTFTTRMAQFSGTYAAYANTDEPVTATLEDLREFPSREYRSPVTSNDAGARLYKITDISPTDPNDTSVILSAGELVGATWPTSGNVVVTGAGLSPGTVTFTYSRDIPAVGAETRMDSEIADFLEAVQPQVDAWLYAALVEAELDPFDGAGIPGNECWRDHGTTHWWVFTDAAYADYMPVQQDAATSHYYHSVRRVYNPETDKYVLESTQEFGFGIATCIEFPPAEGDTIQITIADVPDLPRYQVGDQRTIRIVNSGALQWRGGVGGTATRTYRVAGTDLGQLPQYDAVGATPALYSQSGVTARITPGDRKAKLGDKFSLAVERRSFRWRINGGSWSTDTDVAGGLISLANGLKAKFTPQGVLAYSPGDLFSFTARQVYPPAALLNARSARWRSDDTATPWTITGDCGTAKPVSLIVLGPHNLPSTAVITLKAGTTAAMVDHSVVVPWAENVIAYYLAEPINYRYVGLTVSGAAGAQIQFFYAGQDVWTSVPPVSCDLFDDAEMRGDLEAILAGEGTGAEVTFEGLSGEDHDKIRTAYRHSKQNYDEPVFLIPNYRKPSEVYAVQFPDTLPRGEVRGYQGAEASSQRSHTMRFTLDAYRRPEFV